MKGNRKSWPGAALMVALLSIASTSPSQAQPSNTPPIGTAKASLKANADSKWPVIGHLESAGRRLTIKSGPNGPVYTVKSADGQTLFENLSAEQLRAKSPELHQLIKTGVAAKSGKPDARVKVDASLRAPAGR